MSPVLAPLGHADDSVFFAPYYGGCSGPLSRRLRANARISAGAREYPIEALADDGPMAERAERLSFPTRTGYPSISSRLKSATDLAGVPEL
jgi:hypothetical protein